MVETAPTQAPVQTDEAKRDARRARLEAFNPQAVHEAADSFERDAKKIVELGKEILKQANHSPNA